MTEIEKKTKATKAKPQNNKKENKEEDEKKKISEKNRIYRDNNKEFISTLQKKWYEDNKPKVKEKNKIYRESKLIEIQNCSICNCNIKKLNFKSHTLTKKHIRNLEKTEK